MAGKGSHAVVSLPALDLRRSPDHASEMRSQLLLGEVVRILGRSRDRQWLKVENAADGYRGWVRGWGVTAVPAVRARRWVRRARARVIKLYAEVKVRPGSGTLVSPVFWNGRLIAGRPRGTHRPVELPDGRRGWVERRALQLGRMRSPALLERVRSLLGVPYLWGGRTPLGFDCSGFTQQVLAEQGVLLPRDAHQQSRVSKRIGSGEAPALGDLVFFGRPDGPRAHVGLVLGGGYYAHARGRVRVASMDSLNPLRDRELFGQFRGYWRPPWPPGARAGENRPLTRFQELP